MALTQPIRNPKDVQKLLTYLKQQGNHRNYVLATLGIYTALRISDILNLTTNDVYDFKTKKVRKSITLVEQKSKKSKTIALNKKVIAALASYFPEASPNSPLIINPKTNQPISRTQAHRIISTAAKEAKIPHSVSCHSLRKTFGYHAWQNGISPAIIMDIYNHSSMKITKRYLGVSQDDKNMVYLNLNFTKN